ncbi:MAG: hypothetical protein WC876_02550 [Candidatus Thermoplasmatota archaeon]|jgi:hypothetical protein
MRAQHLLLVPMLLLAGCAGSDASTDDGSPAVSPGANGEHDVLTHILAPEWAIGNYWTLQSPQGGTFTHVVSGEAGDDWTMDTDNPDIAFFDAQGDISFLGKVRKADLAGSQGSSRVEFLRFPLQANLTWTTSWDGAPTTISVVKVADGKADLKATRADGTTYADYTYSDKAGYFSRFVFYDATGTAVGFEWSLQTSGAAFGSPLVRWSLTELFAFHGAIPAGQGGTFLVDPGFTDVYLSTALNCTAGAVTIAIGPPTGPAENRGFSGVGPCPLLVVDDYAVSAPTAAEQWGVLINGVPGATTGTFDIVVHGRVLVEFAAGQAPT